MKYQDKVRFVESANKMIKEGSSREDVESYLKNEGLKSWDIEKINQSIDRQLKDLYKSKIRSYLLDGILESKLSEFDDVDAELFERIQHEVIAEMKSDSTRKIRSMILAGKSEEEIISEVATNRFFEEAEVYEVIESENENIVEKRTQRNKGIGFIILGIILSIGSMNLLSEGVILFQGFVVYGFYVLFRSK